MRKPCHGPRLKSVLVWTVEWDPAAVAELTALDRPVQRRIQRFIDERLLQGEDPRKLGAALTGPWRGHWKYRVGDWRLICRIRSEVITVYVMRIGHRREIYD